jgi:hypothetical protein
MQSRISNFFKPTYVSSSDNSTDDNDDFSNTKQSLNIIVEDLDMDEEIIIDPR